jgi:hypothetical protein
VSTGAVVAANNGTLAFLGFQVSLLGDKIIDVPAASMGIIGFPPTVLTIPRLSTRLVPVGARDRQFAVSGRRRMIRVDRRGSA